MNIPARLEEVLADIQADVATTLRRAIGYTNDQDLRDAMADAISGVLYAHEETRSAIVLCDENNNPPEQVAAGKLHVDSVFVLNGISFQGIYEIRPPEAYEDDAQVKVEFFIRKVRDEQPKRRVFLIDVGGMPERKVQKYLEHVMKAYRNQETQSYQVMSAELASSLKV